VPDIVARVDGQPVSREELLAADPQGLIEAEAALSQARSEALDGLIVRRLLEARAQAESMSPEDWLDREIGARLQPVTDEAVEAFYRENYEQMQGRSLGEIAPRIREHLEGNRAEEAAAEVVKGLTGAARIERLLEPFRVAVDAGPGPRLGPADAPVQIVEFSDFQCPYCARASETVHEVVERYEGQVSVVFRHFPLPFHEAARGAAEASACAGEQGRFWEYHDRLFADQKSWSDADLKGYAKDLSLDAGAFESCLRDGRAAAVVDADMKAGDLAGMSGTPGFFVNGVVMTGAQPVEAFAAVIDAELARSAH
jgi:protein-disulfide isomerase